MKRTLTTIMLGSLLLLASSGILLALGQPIQANPPSQAAAPPAEATACHDPAAATGTLSAEAPWISLALANRESLGLSTEQTRDLTALREGYQRKATEQWREAAAAEEQVTAALSKEPVDLARVKPLIERAAILRAELRLFRAETLQKGRNLLTVEQRGKLQDLASRTGMGMHGASVEFHSPDDMPRGPMM